MPAKSPTITSLTPVQLAKVLSAAGSRSITEEMILGDIDTGAPVNGDGSVNLIHYTAWLVKAASGGGRGESGGE